MCTWQPVAAVFSTTEEISEALKAVHPKSVIVPMLTFKDVT